MKNYNSIPHLSTSKLTQQADKKISKQQEDNLTKYPKDWKDLIVVTEKIDGSNVGIVKEKDKLFAITRSGFLAKESNYKQHNLFASWVEKNQSMFSWLLDGWRIAGEWCIQAHGILYNITGMSPFLAFDIFNDKNKQIDFLSFLMLCAKYKIAYAPVLHIGQPISIKNAVKLLDKGHYGNPEKPEGVVYRLERQGACCYMAKWVRHDKEDGKYLKEQEVFNIGAEEYL